MRLYQADEVRRGRARSELYALLREPIDTGREAFRRDFLSADRTMTDYLHQEMVHTLANDNAELLGPDYPGPLA